MNGLLAVIHAVATPGATPAALPASTPPAATPLPMRDIAPPVEIFPLLPWQVALLIAGGVLLLAALAAGLWWLLRRAPRPPAVPALTPRQAALAALERLRPEVPVLSPYEFAIAVSDVLRTFLERQHGLRAREQTSAEFLAGLSHDGHFTPEDRRLLADFLGRCDLLQFARVPAGPDASEALLGSALAFVQGGRA